MQKVKLSIEIKSIINFFLVGLLSALIIWVLYQTQYLIVSLVISLILAVGLLPIIDSLQEKKVPRALSVVLILVVVAATLTTIGYAVFSSAITQTRALLANIPVYLDNMARIPELNPYISVIEGKIGEYLSLAPEKAVTSTLGAFGGIALAVSCIAVTGYFLVDFYKIRDFLLQFVSKDKRDYMLSHIKMIEYEVGHWLRAQLILMIIVGLLSYIGLMLLGVDYALSLAFIAGLLEFVPFIGPIIATIPAAIVGFGMSPIHGVGVIGLYLIIQQLENNFIVPKVMEKSVGFNPIVTLIVVLIGSSLFDVLGAILAVPFTLVLYIILREKFKLKK